jgi:uncharacterized protein (TIGR02466 family)
VSNIIYPFQIPIYQSFIDQHHFKKIEEDINNFIDKEKFNFKKSWDCNTLSSLFSDSNQDIKSLKLKEQITLHVGNYFKQWDFKKNKIGKAKVKDLWVNIASKGDYQEVHNHPTYFSGSIYINVNKNSGKFVIINPLSTESLKMYPSQIFKYEHFIEPINSMILIFPSWYQHRVQQNKSDIDRISVSFNIDLKFKKK